MTTYHTNCSNPDNGLGLATSMGRDVAHGRSCRRRVRVSCRRRGLAGRRFRHLVKGWLASRPLLVVSEQCVEHAVSPGAIAEDHLA